jgi:hypothetical protein
MLPQNEIFLQFFCEMFCHFHRSSHLARPMSKIFKKSRRSLHVFNTCDQPNSLSLLIPQTIGFLGLPHRCYNYSLHGTLVFLMSLPTSSTSLDSSVNLLSYSSPVNETSKCTSFAHPTITYALLPLFFASFYLYNPPICKLATSFKRLLQMLSSVHMTSTISQVIHAEGTTQGIPHLLHVCGNMSSNQELWVNLHYPRSPRTFVHLISHTTNNLMSHTTDKCLQISCHASFPL